MKNYLHLITDRSHTMENWSFALHFGRVRFVFQSVARSVIDNNPECSNELLKRHRINLFRMYLSALFPAIGCHCTGKEKLFSLSRSSELRISHTGRKRELFEMISRLHWSRYIWYFSSLILSLKVSISSKTLFIGNVHLCYNMLLLLLLSDNNWHLFFLFRFCLWRDLVFFFLLHFFCSFLLPYYCF